MDATIGRIVHYIHPNEDKYGGVPLASVVVDVISSTELRLFVLDGLDSKTYFLSAYYAEQYTPARWSWPPRV